MSFRPLLRKPHVIEEKGKPNRLVYHHHAVVEWVETEISRLIKLTDVRGTFAFSMLPGGRGLAKLDAGAPRANVGRVLAFEGSYNHDGLEVGDIVLYDQHAAPWGFTAKHAELLGELYADEMDALGSDPRDSDGRLRTRYCLYLPFAALACKLNAVPAPGVVR